MELPPPISLACTGQPQSQNAPSPPLSANIQHNAKEHCFSTSVLKVPGVDCSAIRWLLSSHCAATLEFWNDMHQFLSVSKSSYALQVLTGQGKIEGGANEEQGGHIEPPWKMQPSHNCLEVMSFLHHLLLFVLSVVGARAHAPWPPASTMHTIHRKAKASLVETIWHGCSTFPLSFHKRLISCSFMLMYEESEPLLTHPSLLKLH